MVSRRLPGAPITTTGQSQAPEPDPRHSIGGETQMLNALRATVEDGSGPMNHFSPALGVDLALTDHAYALAALSWWWATRVSGPGLC